MEKTIGAFPPKAVLALSTNVTGPPKTTPWREGLLCGPDAGLDSGRWRIAHSGTPHLTQVRLEAPFQGVYPKYQAALFSDEGEQLWSKRSLEAEAFTAVNGYFSISREACLSLATTAQPCPACLPV
jgi:hypothetical protein